ncbi:hypothetical protein AB0C97_35260, partial [Streptomyces goshikiensis]
TAGGFRNRLEGWAAPKSERWRNHNKVHQWIMAAGPPRCCVLELFFAVRLAASLARADAGSGSWTGQRFQELCP